jgi:mannose-6-phosphate isomerase-like protein (cupin superfamily)
MYILTGHGPPIPNRFCTHRVRWLDYSWRLGGVLPLHRRAVCWTTLPDKRPPKSQFDPQPWDGTEIKLPGVCENGGYYLREGAGEKWAVGGTVVRPLATRKETKGRFSIYSLEGSSLHTGKGLSKAVEFKDTHHAIFIVDGVVKLVIDGSEVKTTVGETTFVPAGTKWTLEAESVYTFSQMGVALERSCRMWVRSTNSRWCRLMLWRGTRPS